LASFQEREPTRVLLHSSSTNPGRGWRQLPVFPASSVWLLGRSNFAADAFSS